MIRYANRPLDQSAFRGKPRYKVCTRLCSFDVSSHVTHDSISIRDAKCAFACARASFQSGGALRTPLPTPAFSTFSFHTHTHTHTDTLFLSIEIVEKYRSPALTIAPNRPTDRNFPSIVKWVSPSRSRRCF